MGLSWDEAGEVKDAFKQKYFPDPRQAYYSQGVNGIGITWLERMKEMYEELCLPKEKEFVLKQGESLEDYCLKVNFEKEPSKDLQSKLPLEFTDSKSRSLRVFYLVVGEIIFAKQ